MQFVCKPKDRMVRSPLTLVPLEAMFINLNNKKLYFYVLKIYCSPVFHRHFASPALQRHFVWPRALL
jgi:hypothetical protein